MSLDTENLINILRDNAVLIGVIVFLAAAVFMGSRKGLMIKLLSLCSVIVTLVIEMHVYPMAMVFIQNNETVNSFLTDLGERIVTGAATGLISGVTGAATGSNASETGGLLQGAAYAQTEIAAGSVASSPLYDILELDTLADNAVQAVGDVAAKVICFIAIFIVIRIIVKLLTLIVRGLKKIRVIDWLDRLCGGLFGFGEGMIYVWLFMLIVSAFPGYSFCSFVIGQISESQILKYIYAENLIVLFFAELLR